MPREVSRFGRARSSRFGSGPSSVFNPGQPHVFRLNKGSSSHGRDTTLPLNKPGGTFGAGFPSGGSALAAALSSSGPGVVGSPEIGPGPAPPPSPDIPPPPIPPPPMRFPSSVTSRGSSDLPEPPRSVTSFSPTQQLVSSPLLDALTLDRRRRSGGGLFAI